MSTNTGFRGTPQIDLRTFDSFIWGSVKTAKYSGPVENEETLYKRICMPVIPFTTAPGAVERPRNSMTRRIHAALIR